MEQQTGKPISTPREHLQKAIVYVILGLLVATFGVMIVSWWQRPTLELEDFASKVLTPVLALSGPVLGFYFNDRRK